jgi:hypothetical protein
VIVASKITQTGSVVAGDVRKMVVIKTNPGYDSNPGHAGTGTVVSISCQPATTASLLTTWQNNVLWIGPNEVQEAISTKLREILAD